jgi:hypothetical protein
VCYSLWYNAPTMLLATTRQHRGCIIPQSVNTQSSAPEDGPNNFPKHVELTNTQSSAPEDGPNNFPKHVELTGIINKI